MTTTITGAKFHTYYTPWISYDVTENTATKYTFRLNLGVTSTNSATTTYGSSSLLHKKIGNGEWLSTRHPESMGTIKAKTSTTIISGDLWTVTKTHSPQTVTIAGIVMLLYESTDGSAAKLQLSTVDGVVIYNENGTPVAQYGEDTIIGDKLGFHIKIDGDENEIGFFRGDMKVAYMNGAQLYVENSLSFGHFMFYERNNGHFTLKYIGGN